MKRGNRSAVARNLLLLLSGLLPGAGPRPRPARGGGGLGIGNASTYLWDAALGALFRVSRRLMISAGYRQFRYDRADGEGGSEVKQTVSVVGPAIGLSFGIF